MLTPACEVFFFFFSARTWLLSAWSLIRTMHKQDVTLNILTLPVNGNLVRSWVYVEPYSHDPLSWAYSFRKCSSWLYFSCFFGMFNPLLPSWLNGLFRASFFTEWFVLCLLLDWMIFSVPPPYWLNGLICASFLTEWFVPCFLLAQGWVAGQQHRGANQPVWRLNGYQCIKGQLNGYQCIKGRLKNPGYLLTVMDMHWLYTCLLLQSWPSGGAVNALFESCCSAISTSHQGSWLRVLLFPL